MKKSSQLIIGLIVSFLAVAYTVRNVSVEEIMSSFREVGMVHIVLTLLLMALTYITRALRWQALVSAIKPVPLKSLFSPLMVGYMAGILPARAGEFVRAFLLGKSQNLSFAGAFATIVVERLFDLILLIGLVAWVFVFHSELFDLASPISGVSLKSVTFHFGWFSGLIALGLLIFIGLLAYQKEKAQKLVSWLLRPFPEKWQKTFLGHLETFQGGLDAIKNPRSLLKISLLSILIWAIAISTYYPLYWAYGFQDKSLTSLIVLTVLICVLITVLPTPAFLGSFNAGVLIALHELMGESELHAVSYGFVAWGLNFSLVVVSGLYFMIHDHISLKKLEEAEQEIV